MKIIITMAGRGQRFRDAGYDMPKYMIDVLGRSLFEWSLLSLSDFFDSNFVFIARSEDHPDSFIKQKCFELNIHKFNIVTIDNTTDGQATTVLLSSKFINDEDQIVIYNIDTYVEEGYLKRDALKGDGLIPGFKAAGDKWSFIKMNDYSRVTDIAEKNPISDIATLGLYYFKSFSTYKEFYTETFNTNSNLVNGEKYIAVVYKTMLNKGADIFGTLIPSNKVWGLGTPEDVLSFSKNYGRL